jgi:hypothetical protein
MASRKATGEPGTNGRRVMALTNDWMLERRKRRFEWIAMEDGSEACIWSSTVGDTLQVIRAASRPGPLAELGPDEAMAVRMQIALSLHDGEPPEGRRIFSDDNLQLVDLLSPREMNLVLLTASRLNGMDQEAMDRLEGFMKRTEGATSPS